MGVAVSDERRVLAVGYGVWPATEPEFYPRLVQAVRDEDIEALVVGYPLTLRGEVGPQARAVDRFIAGLESRGYLVFRCDERNTTFTAARSLSRAGISERRQRGRIDMSAAVLMLQSYLDAQSARDTHSP
jgi:putative holliday junction resolvase